jgi:hypothetical protein
MDVNLNLRLRKTGRHKHHPQAAFHGGLGFWLGQLDNAPEPRDAPSSRMAGNVTKQVVQRHELCV